MSRSPVEDAPRKRPVKTLPLLFVEKEHRKIGLRYRASASSSPETTSPPRSPVGTSTPISGCGYLDQYTPARPKYRERSLSVNIEDSGYGELDTKCNDWSNLTFSPVQELVSIYVTSPVREIRKRWRGRPSYLDPVRTSSKLEEVTKGIDPHTVLVWLVIIMMVTSLGFAILISFGGKIIDFNKLRWVEMEGDETEQSLLGNERLVEIPDEDSQGKLGGKRASIKFAADKIALSNVAAGADNTEMEDVSKTLRNSYDDFEEEIINKQNNTDPDKAFEILLMQNLDVVQRLSEGIKVGPTPAKSFDQLTDEVKISDDSEDASAKKMKIERFLFKSKESSREAGDTFQVISKKSKNKNPLFKPVKKPKMSKITKLNIVSEQNKMDIKSGDISGETPQKRKVSKPLFIPKQDEIPSSKVNVQKKPSRSKSNNPLRKYLKRTKTTKNKKNKPVSEGSSIVTNASIDEAEGSAVESTNQARRVKRQVDEDKFRKAKTRGDGFRKVSLSEEVIE